MNCFCDCFNFEMKKKKLKLILTSTLYLQLFQNTSLSPRTKITIIYLQRYCSVCTSIFFSFVHPKFTLTQINDNRQILQSYIYSVFAQILQHGRYSRATDRSIFYAAKATENFARLCQLIMTIFSDLLRDVLSRYIKPADLRSELDNNRRKLEKK